MKENHREMGKFLHEEEGNPECSMDVVKIIMMGR
jgi:hypothetical protein